MNDLQKLKAAEGGIEIIQQYALEIIGIMEEVRPSFTRPIYEQLLRDISILRADIQSAISVRHQ
jgi:hypothetical protein